MQETKRLSRRKHSGNIRKTVRLNPDDIESKSVIINPELREHRRMFLGKPGSKKWQEYYKGLVETKRRLFKEESMQDYNEKVLKHKISIRGGNGNDDNVAIATAIASANATENANTTATDNVNANATENANTTTTATENANANANANANTTAATENGELNDDEEVEILTNIVELLINELDNTSEQNIAPINDIKTNNNQSTNNDVNVKSSTNGKQDNTVKKQITATQQPLKNVTKFKVSDVNSGTGNCKRSEWLGELFNTEENYKMYNLLDFADKGISNDTIQLPTDWQQYTDVNKPISKTLNELIDSGKLCKAEDVKIQLIPFLLQVYLSLINTIKNQNPDDESNQKSEQLREMILYCIEVLRNINMYSSPMFFDDLYYYYYFLSLDQIFPNMDDFFRLFEYTPKPPKNSRDSKVNVKMRTYEMFPNDTPDKENDEARYGYEMKETVTGANPETNFDMFLNMVQIHPDFYYKLPVKSSISRDFVFKEIPVNKDDPNTQHIAKLYVESDDQEQDQEQDQTQDKEKEGQGGGGIYDLFTSSIGASNSYGTGEYKYLEDNPLARNFEDILKDENDVFDGNVHLCIYSLDKSCDFDGNGPTPFLKFITTKNSNSWVFPSFQYKSLQDPEQNNTSFKCDMYNFLLNTLELKLCGEMSGGDKVVDPLTQEQNPSADPSSEQQSLVNQNMDQQEQSPMDQQDQSQSIVDLPTEPQNQPMDQQEQPQSIVDLPTDQQEQSPMDQQNQPQSIVDLPTDQQEQSPMDQQEQPQSIVDLPTEQQISESSDVPTDTSFTDTTMQEPSTSEPVVPVPVPVPELNKEPYKHDCSKIDTSLDSIYIGLVSEDIQGTRQIFVFMNYDLLNKLVKSPENDSYDAIFCRYDNTQIYPIADANPNSKLKWATVDELFFEKKITEEPVDPMIAELFMKRESLWNIEDSAGLNIHFPFVVYGVKMSPENRFENITTSEDMNDQIENYGSDDMHDEYAERYCFTITPMQQSSDTDQSSNPDQSSNSVTDQLSESIMSGGNATQPRRYAMFAWKTRYILKDEEPSQSQPNTEGDTFEEGEDTSTEILSEVAMTKLQFPTIYTITNNESTDNQPVVTWGILNRTQFVGM